VDFTFDYSGRIDPDGQTLRLSRFIGPGGFDADYVFTRLENMPQ